MKNIILFGPAGAGKSTVAKMMIDIIKNRIGNSCGVYRLSLGRKIKLIGDELRYDPCQESRELYQAIGQGLRRDVGGLVWCKWVEREMDQIKKDNSLDNAMFIIDDGRQHNEYDFWGKQGFIQVGVIASLETRANRLFDRDGYDQRGNLRFENEITADDIAREKCQYLIRNEGTIEELREMVRQFIDMATWAQGEWDK